MAQRNGGFTLVEYDEVRRILASDARNVVVRQLDASHRISDVYIWSLNGKVSDTSEEMVQRLLQEGHLLPAPRLTPELTYVHAQSIHKAQSN